MAIAEDEQQVETSEQALKSAEANREQYQQQEIKQKYLENNTLPESDRRHNAIKVNQIHPITNEVVKVFLSYTDIMHDYQVSLRKIKQVMNNNEIYKGYKWQLVTN
jgi:hypothetical protein